MQALMQSWPLTIDRVLEHAAAGALGTGVVTPGPEGVSERSGWGEIAVRARRLAAALRADGVRPGDLVAVIAAPSARALEAWYAIMGMGAVCHPLSPGLDPASLEAALGVFGDKAAFLDPELLAPLEAALRRCKLRRIVTLSGAEDGASGGPGVIADHESMIEGAGASEGWGGFDEALPAALVHSVGARGPARGVVLSHRALVLQAMTAAGPDGYDLISGETVLSLMPFWRAAGFGLPFAAPLAGAALVLPGAAAGPDAVRALVDETGAEAIVAPPAGLAALYEHYRFDRARPQGLRRAFAAGAPCPTSLASRWLSSFDVRLKSAWGLAETSGLAAVFDPARPGLRPPFALELKVVDAEGHAPARGGASAGRLLARGPMTASGYAPGARALGDDGFLDTGDLAAIDGEGRISLMGRADQIVHVLGEAVPAAPLEAAAMEHPSVALAAALDSPWTGAASRPVLVVARKPGTHPVKADVLRVMAERLGRPAEVEDVLFVDAAPTDLAGRLDRRALLRQIEPVLLPPAPREPEPEPEAEIMAEPEPAPAPALEDEPDPTGPSAAAPEVEPQPTVAIAEAAATPAVIYAPDETETPAPEVELADAGLAVPDDVVPPPAPSEAIAGLAPAEPETPPDEPEQTPVEETAAAVPAVEQDPPAPSAEPPEPDPAPAEAAPSPPHPLDAPLTLDRDEPPAAVPLFAPRTFDRPARTRSRPRPAAPSASRIFVSATCALALVAPVLIISGVAAARLGVADWTDGLHELMVAWPSKIALVGLVGGILGALAALNVGFHRLWRPALAGLLVPLLTLMGLAAVHAYAARFPPVHEAATDWSDPIVFSRALMKARGPGDNPILADPVVPPDAGAFMNRHVADVNAETCPGARTLVLPFSPDQAYAAARTAVLADGLDLFTDQEAAGRLEATASDPWLGFKSDLAVRVRPDPAGARVDLRSISRQGLSDFGSNCARVTRLVAAIRTAAQ